MLYCRMVVMRMYTIAEKQACVSGDKAVYIVTCTVFLCVCSQPSKISAKRDLRVPENALFLNEISGVVQISFT